MGPPAACDWLALCAALRGPLLKAPRLNLAALKLWMLNALILCYVLPVVHTSLPVGHAWLLSIVDDEGGVCESLSYVYTFPALVLPPSFTSAPLHPPVALTVAACHHSLSCSCALPAVLALHGHELTLAL